jgi:excisionase family DNA binding protein
VAERYYTIKEAAERLRVSHDTISRLIGNGELPAIRVSQRLYRIPTPALERYESGLPVVQRRVVRRRVAQGIVFGADERGRDLEPA